MQMRAWLAGVAALLTIGSAAQAGDEEGRSASGEQLPAWSRGYLDIHHISTGRGNASYFILPDGTTMLVDAGDVDVEAMQAFEPLKLQDARPDASRRPGQWIADYIRQFAPPGAPPRLDYALVTHFHSDHFGTVVASSPVSETGAYRLTGITDVADAIPIGRLIDRAGPDYRFPADLRTCPNNRDGSLANYFRFVDHLQDRGVMVEAFVPGRADQIRLRFERDAFPTFAIRNIAANGMVWNGRGTRTRRHIPAREAGGCTPPENPLSLAFKLSYGAFDYFAGGDLTGIHEINQPHWHDMETPVAAAVGPVDAMTLNHHGNRDATNATFLRTLRPRVIVQQSWVSDQPGGEVVHRMISKALWPEERAIFATGIMPETEIAIGPWIRQNYQALNGHILIRVAPGGGSYHVFVLEDGDAGRRVRARFGPYSSRNAKPRSVDTR